MKRRILLFLDGTWNDELRSEQDTNIVRLRDLVSKAISNEVFISTVKDVKSYYRLLEDPGIISFQDSQYMIFYERGVGTGPGVDRLLGGMTGKGLELNIRRAYRFLCANYRSGDEVFVFGFSRGAFTARSLVNLIEASGLIKSEHCVPESEQKAWQYYQQRANDRFSGDRAILNKFTHPRNEVRIACLGVFDTVGSLGIPLKRFKLYNRARYEFHDVGLSPIVDLNLHALAIDECRLEFPASVWRENKFKAVNTLVEQVWFPGVHADIGGGYYSVDQRGPLSKRIDDISLDWIVKRLRHHYPDFPKLKFNYIPDSVDIFDIAQHESRKGGFRLRPRAFRSIGNLKPESKANAEVVSHDRNESVIGESVHISAIERLGTIAVRDNKKILYAPPNLVANFENLYSRYVAHPGQKRRAHSLSIVDWDGKIAVAPQVSDASTKSDATSSSESPDSVCTALKQANDRLRKHNLL